MGHLHGSQLQKFTRSDLHVLNVYHFTQISLSLSPYLRHVSNVIDADVEGR